MAKLTLQNLDARVRVIEDQLSISRPLEIDTTNTRATGIPQNRLKRVLVRLIHNKQR